MESSSHAMPWILGGHALLLFLIAIKQVIFSTVKWHAC